MSILTESTPPTFRFDVRLKWCRGIRSEVTKRLKYESYTPLLTRDPQNCLVGDLLLEVGATESKGTVMEVPMRTKSGKLRRCKRPFMFFRCLGVLDGGFQMPLLEGLCSFYDTGGGGFHSKPGMRMWLWIRES